MRIRWTPTAAADLHQISDYLSENSPHYRVATMQKLYSGIRALKQWPLRGRPGTEDGTRELLFLPLPYVAVYRVKEEAVEILRIYHAAQDRPQGLWLSSWPASFPWYAYTCRKSG